MIATNQCIGISVPDEALLFVICSPVGPYFRSGFSAVRLFAEEKHVRAWPGGTGAYKIGANYGPTIALQRDAVAANYQQILWLLGPENEITEVGSMNCFIVLKDKNGQVELLTPPLTDGTILPGVTRDSILQLSSQIKGVDYVTERKITMKELLQAHSEGRILEMFGSGTAAIVSPIKCVHFQGRDYEIPINEAKQTGPVAEHLFSLITAIQVKSRNGCNYLHLF